MMNKTLEINPNRPVLVRPLEKVKTDEGTLPPFAFQSALVEVDGNSNEKKFVKKMIIESMRS